MKKYLSYTLILTFLLFAFFIFNMNVSGEEKTEPAKTEEKKETPKPRSLEKFTVSTEDDIILVGQFMQADTPAKPTIILIPQLGQDMTTYQKLLPKLTEKGYGICLYDPRGHGQSIKNKKGDTITFRKFHPEGKNNDWNKMKNDLGLVINFLKKEKSVNGDNLKLIGASIGANIVLNYAAEHSEIKTIILLSPGMTYHDVNIKDSLLKCTGKNVLAVATKNDTYSADTCREIKRAILAEQARQGLSEKENIKYFELPGSNHGTYMLDPDVIKEILDWLKM